MALVLTLRKNFSVAIGEEGYVVSYVDTAFNFTLQRVRDGKEFMVQDKNWTEVSPGISVKAGIPLDENGKLVRLMIQAPKEVLIVRGTNAVFN